MGPVSKSVSQYSTLLIILLGISLGFLSPNIGQMWKAYLPYLLMLLMFFVSLTIEPKEIMHSIKNYPLIALMLFTVFVVTPSLSLLARPLFSQADYTGTVLAFTCPSAIATGFWCSVICGDVATGLVISMVSNLLAIVTLPFTMLLFLGTAAKINTGWMILNLAELILIPLGASFLLKAITGKNLRHLSGYTSKANLIIMMLLIWGSIAPGVADAEKNILEFASLNVFMLIMLALAFCIAYRLSKKQGREQAVTMGIASSVKNATLSLVLGLTVLGPNILSPLIANLIGQNILMIPLTIIFKKRRSNSL
jgi:predicted Na+-dependent transporter